MNTDQFMSILRQFATLGGTIAVTTAHASPDQVQTYIGGASIIAASIWSMFTHAK